MNGVGGQVTRWVFRREEEEQLANAEASKANEDKVCLEGGGMGVKRERTAGK